MILGIVGYLVHCPNEILLLFSNYTEISYLYLCFIARLISILGVSLYLSSIVSILREAVHSEPSLLVVITVLIPFASVDLQDG